jgi:heme exporter protein A
MGAGGPFQEELELRADALTLARGGRVLFERLSFVVRGGEFLELRGANGAGKTSLLRAAAGYLRPAAGRIGFARLEEPALALHYLGHQNGLKPSVSVTAHVRYWAGLFSVAASPNAVLRQAGLAGLAELPTRALSQGQARRLALTRLLIAPRPIWLLDEPGAALDADGRAMLGAMIDAQRARGGMVVAAVHGAMGPTPTRTLTLGGS